MDGIDVVSAKVPEGQVGKWLNTRGAARLMLDGAAIGAGKRAGNGADKGAGNGADNGAGNRADNGADN